MKRGFNTDLPMPLLTLVILSTRAVKEAYLNQFSNNVILCDSLCFSKSKAAKAHTDSLSNPSEGGTQHPLTERPKMVQNER